MSEALAFDPSAFVYERFRFVFDSCLINKRLGWPEALIINIDGFATTASLLRKKKKDLSILHKLRKTAEKIYPIPPSEVINGITLPVILKKTDFIGLLNDSH